MNRNDYSPAGPPSQVFNRFGFQKEDPAGISIPAGMRTPTRNSVEDLFKPKNGRLSPIDGSNNNDASFKSKPPPDFFESFKTRKSLRELNLEKQKERDMYCGLAAKIVKSPQRHYESRLLGSSISSERMFSPGDRAKSPYETPLQIKSKAMTLKNQTERKPLVNAGMLQMKPTTPMHESIKNYGQSMPLAY